MIERYVHHNILVAVRADLKGKHRNNCLCYDGCIHFKPGSPDNCPIAADTYLNCLKHGITTPVYECPKFETGLPPKEAA